MHCSARPSSLPTSSSWSNSVASGLPDDAGSPLLAIAAAASSERGQRASNEDQVRICAQGAHWLAVLADGAGGHQGGAEASRRAVEHMPQALDAGATGFDPGALTRAVVSAHRCVLEGQRGGRGLDRMHSTVVVLWIDTRSGTALWAHVGDSRLYLVRRGVLRQLTSDDSVVQRMVEAGVLTPQQAQVHPNKNQLIAALGIEDEIEPHTLQHAAALQPGDAFLLCSDGWWDSLDEAGILASLADADTPQEWLLDMQRRIEARARERQDNFSAIAAWVRPAAAAATPPGDGAAGSAVR
jgi:PPM family protein phosphatase